MQDFKRTAIACALALCAFCGGLPATAEDIIVKPTGEYASIDTSDTKNAMTRLQSHDKAERTAIIAAIKEHPDKFTPPVFYVMSNVIYNDAKEDTAAKDEAAFWFYAGQLRGRYDANRCADTSARAAIGVLNTQFGGPINRYMFLQSNLSKLEALIPKVVQWDKDTPHNYDQRWINLHGMGAMMSGMGADSEGKQQKPVLSLPESEWNAIAEKTRDDYLKGFSEAMQQLKAAGTGGEKDRAKGK